MKYFINYESYSKSKGPESAALIKEAGFDGVFISWQDGNITFSDVNRIKQAGLEIQTMHLSYNIGRKYALDLWRNTDKAEEVKNILMSEIDGAIYTGTPIVVCHPSAGGLADEEINQTGLKNYIDIVRYASDNGITVAFENIRSLQIVEFMLKNLKDYNVGFCFDIGHGQAFTHNLYDYDFSFVLDHVKCLHIHDNDGSSDAHLIPGFGNIRFVEILKKVKKHNPDIDLTLELKYQPQAYGQLDELDFYKLAYSKIKEIGDQL